VDINQSFASDYLRSADYAPEEQRTLTIKVVSMEKVGNEPKPVMSFLEMPQGLVLNQTNAGTIAAAYGRETDHWPGKKITLYVTLVAYAGKQIPGIRVRIPGGAEAPPPGPVSPALAKKAGVTPPPPTKRLPPPPGPEAPPDMKERWKVWDGTQEVTMSRGEILDMVKDNASTLEFWARKQDAIPWVTVEAQGLGIPF